LLRERECIGSVNHEGCTPICLTNSRECNPCGGLNQKTNLKKLRKLLKEMGYNEKEIENRVCRLDLEAK
jgi:hypothetical protein